MGYCSDVALAFSDRFRIPEDVRKALAGAFQAAMTVDSIYYPNSVLFVANGIKWYEDFPNVKLIENYMTKLDSLEADPLEVKYTFVRIGEDDTDVAQRENWAGDCPFQPYVRRYLEFIQDGAIELNYEVPNI